MASDKAKISVVIPVYNSQQCLPELLRKLERVLKRFGKTYEIILVNDGSQDSSWEKIVELSKVYKRLKGINLRRNFGQDNAIMAGLSYSSGESVIVMDDDFQHDPEDIPSLLSGLEKGYDVCYAYFSTKKQSWFKNFGSWFSDKVANAILRKPAEIYLSPYKAIKRELIDEILNYDGPYPYVDGLLFRVTRNITQIAVKHHFRYRGKGNYTFWKSINVWLKLATNFSVFPLRLASFLGFVASIIGSILAIYFIVGKLIGIVAPSGWASLVVIVLFLGGVQLISIGVIGEYVGRLFLHQSKEPQFVTRTKVGFEKMEK